MALKSIFNAYGATLSSEQEAVVDGIQTMFPAESQMLSGLVLDANIKNQPEAVLDTFRAVLDECRLLEVAGGRDEEKRQVLRQKCQELGARMA